MNQTFSFTIRCFQILILALCAWFLNGCTPSSQTETPPHHQTNPSNEYKEPLPTALMETRHIRIGSHTLFVEVAKHPLSREKGLMNRSFLPANNGMLFVFPVPQSISMWMKNTLIPLDVAFINERGIIIKIERMAPQTLTHHRSGGVIAYALEVNAGWFEQHNIQTGAHITNLPPYLDAEQ